MAQWRLDSRDQELTITYVENWWHSHCGLSYLMHPCILIYASLLLHLAIIEFSTISQGKSSYLDFQPQPHYPPPFGHLSPQTTRSILQAIGGLSTVRMKFGRSLTLEFGTWWKRWSPSLSLVYNTQPIRYSPTTEKKRKLSWEAVVRAAEPGIKPNIEALIWNNMQGFIKIHKAALAPHAFFPVHYGKCSRSWHSRELYGRARKPRRKAQRAISQRSECFHSLTNTHRA